MTCIYLWRVPSSIYFQYTPPCHLTPFPNSTVIRTGTQIDQKTGPGTLCWPQSITALSFSPTCMQLTDPFLSLIPLKLLHALEPSRCTALPVSCSVSMDHRFKEREWDVGGGKLQRIVPTPGVITSKSRAEAPVWTSYNWQWKTQAQPSNDQV